MRYASDHLGQRMHAMVRRMYPWCRSITGEGLRNTLCEIQNLIPITIHEIPTGTQVLDWNIPEEWNVTAARIERLNGQVIVDFAHCNLHVVSYSKPINRVISRDELASHVHTLPEQPHLVPYRTAYWAKDWGFCLSHHTWQEMRDEEYRIVIESSLKDGSLSYGELVIPGNEDEEFLISTHCCHPSLANDNLSGIAVATEVARCLRNNNSRLSYRFLFIPSTIGALAWLAQNDNTMPRIAHGLVLSCLGDTGSFHYKRSRRGNALVDRSVAQVLRDRRLQHEILNFSPYGHDERQYCSPAYNMPVGCLTRSPHGTFPQYHNSSDNIDFVTADSLEESLRVVMDTIDLIERNATYARIDGRGEPNLGSRGLYRSISGQADHTSVQMALLWILNLADGNHDLLDMAERSNMSFEEIAEAADVAYRAELLQRMEPAA